MNEAILEAMAANDQTYEPDVDEDEDFLQTSNNFKRPVTADTGVEAVRKKQCSLSSLLCFDIYPEFPNKLYIC